MKRKSGNLERSSLTVKRKSGNLERSSLTMKRLLLTLILCASLASGVAYDVAPNEPHGYLLDGETLTAEWLEGMIGVLYTWARGVDERVYTLDGGTDGTGLSGDIASNAASIASNTVDITVLDGRIATAEADITSLDGRVASAEIDITVLDGRIATAEADITALDGRVASAEADITSLDGRVTVNEGDILTLDGRIASAEADVASHVLDISALDGRVTVNEGDISSHTTDISALAGRVTANEVDVASHTQDIIALQGQVSGASLSTPDGTAAFAPPFQEISFSPARSGTGYGVLITPMSDPGGMLGEFWVDVRTTTVFRVYSTGTATGTFFWKIFD